MICRCWFSAAPKLKDVSVDGSTARELYLQCIQLMRTVYHSCHLIHADLSEFNLLWEGNTIFLLRPVVGTGIWPPLNHVPLTLKVMLLHQHSVTDYCVGFQCCWHIEFVIILILYVCWKADINQLNIPHLTVNLAVKVAVLGYIFSRYYHGLLYLIDSQSAEYDRPNVLEFRRNDLRKVLF